MMPQTRRGSNDEDKIWADAGQPATLIDGDKSTDYYTLDEAVRARDLLPPPQKNAASIKSGGRIFTSAEIDRLSHRSTPAKPEREALRVLVDLQKLSGANGGGEVVLTYQCARPTKRQVGSMLVPDIERYFETEKLPYKTDEEGEELM